MGKKITFRAFLAVILLVIMYEIWPLPFWFVAKRVILPASEKVSDGFNIVASPFRFLYKMANLDRENRRLENDNKSLNAEAARLTENVHLCSAINSEVNLSRLNNFNLIQGKIVGRTPGSFNQDIVVNLGLKDGIKEGAAVLSSGYLIGQVKKVDQAQSEIHLIFSHSSLIPAVLEKSRETGLVQGGLRGLSLTEIPATTQVKTKDRVLTSALGGDLPPGILIGETQEVLKEKNNLFQSVKINSPIEISTLEVVSIIR